LSIVLAVRVAGVIPVFSYLIIPPVSAILLTRKRSAAVIVALTVSVVGSFLGLYFSTHFDFPAGSSVVAILGGLFLVVAIIRSLKGKLVTLSGKEE
jgi:ABC-type Mn2+/Zn2+ transport system permease subunit